MEMKNSSLFLILQKMRVPFIVLIIAYTVAIIGLVSIDGVTSDGKIYHMSIFDAFYFVTYTATTIGFGETPYVFTYPQRIWVSMLIYITVIGWFYSIGSIISLVQDKILIKELARARFKKQIKNLKEDFFIILGFNSTTRKIIEKSLKKGFRVVVIERNEERVNELLLEAYTPIVPVIQADIYDPVALEISGIKSRYCKGLVSLFEDDNLNLRIAITCKLTNPNVPLAIKSTTENLTENLSDVGVEIIENPFSIISNHLHLSLNSPSIYQIEKWVYNIDTLEKDPIKLPRGKYIICGYGRMGKKLYHVLEENKIEATFIEIDINQLKNPNKRGVVIGDADDRDMLKDQGIEEAVVIIAGTNDDTTNLSLLSTAKKLNPNIITIARENELENYSIFQYSKIDYVYMLSKILIHKTVNALINPMSDKFLILLKKQNEAFGANLIRQIMDLIGANPKIFELIIDANQAHAIVNALHVGHPILLDYLLRRRDDRVLKNSVITLLLQRGNKFHLLPHTQMLLKEGDKLLFAASYEASQDVEYIAQNIHELEYISNNFEEF
ncbi:potassium channel family protein [Sulfurospirillum sp. 1612]|uniref:potassium channel family protein n=1 Tax=Sulfurospirillum sp. 1612 TaxID=3094835 RepID=UPI002F927A21